MTDVIAEPRYRLTDSRALDYHEDERLDLGYRPIERLEDPARAVLGSIDAGLPAGVTERGLADLREWLGRIDALTRRGDRVRLVRLLTEFALRAATLTITFAADDRQCAGPARPSYGRHCRFRGRFVVDGVNACKRHAEERAGKLASDTVDAYAAEIEAATPSAYGGSLYGAGTAAERNAVLRNSLAIARHFDELDGFRQSPTIDEITASYVERWGAIA